MREAETSEQRIRKLRDAFEAWLVQNRHFMSVHTPASDIYYAWVGGRLTAHEEAFARARAALSKAQP